MLGVVHPVDLEGAETDRAGDGVGVHLKKREAPGDW
jgi:hypothetical protein